MKTVKFSLMALLFIFFVSCSKDEDKPDVNDSEVLGTWTLQDLSYDGTTAVTYGETNMLIESSAVTTASDLVVDFKENGTYTAQGGYTVLLTTEGMEFEVPLDMESSTGSWDIVGDKMKFSDGFVTLSTGQALSSEPNEVVIKEISASKMVLSFTTEEVIEQGGFENVINVEGEYVFTK